MVNIVNLKKLLSERYKNNLSAFAKEMEMSKSTLSTILNSSRNAGVKTINKIIVYCKKNKLDVSNYIFLM